MGKFMQCSAVVACGVLEGLLWWQVNGVRHPIVESEICLIVENGRAGIPQNSFTRLDHFEQGPLLPGPRRNAFDLLCVEHGVDTVNQSVSARLVRLVRRLMFTAV